MSINQVAAQEQVQGVYDCLGRLVASGEITIDGTTAVAIAVDYQKQAFNGNLWLVLRPKTITAGCDGNVVSWTPGAPATRGEQTLEDAASILEIATGVNASAAARIIDIVYGISDSGNAEQCVSPFGGTITVAGDDVGDNGILEYEVYI